MGKGSGLWSVASGQSPVGEGSGLWSVASGQSPVGEGSGLWSVASGPVASGGRQWPVVSGELRNRVLRKKLGFKGGKLGFWGYYAPFRGLLEVVKTFCCVDK